MRMQPREFPSGRRRRPKRQAERRVYEALAGSDRRGFCYYEWRRGYESLELDFAVWVERLGRFALQVKGGPHLLIDGEWYRRTPAGVRPVGSSPLDEAWLAALDLHDDIEELAETDYSPFVTSPWTGSRTRCVFLSLMRALGSCPAMLQIHEAD